MGGLLAAHTGHACTPNRGLQEGQVLPVELQGPRLHQTYLQCRFCCALVARPETDHSLISLLLTPFQMHAVAYVKYDRASSAALAMESLNGAVLNDGRGPRLKVLLAEAPSAR